MRLIFIRHGEPDYEHDTLTAVGKREAELLVPRVELLKEAEFFCSPLGRAVDTAKPSLEKIGKEAKILDWLMEFPAHIKDPETGKDRIPWDLMPSYWTNIKQLYDKDEWINAPVMTTGNVRSVYSDVIKNFDALLEEHGYKRNGNTYEVIKENTDTLVFFCHFGISSVLISHLLGLSPLVLWQSFVTLPSSVTTVISEEREKGVAYFRCNAYGDISHLYKEGQNPSFSARFCEVYSNEERH